MFDHETGSALIKAVETYSKTSKLDGAFDFPHLKLPKVTGRKNRTTPKLGQSSRDQFAHADECAGEYQTWNW